MVAPQGGKLRPPRGSTICSKTFFGTKQSSCSPLLPNFVFCFSFCVTVASRLLIPAFVEESPVFSGFSRLPRFYWNCRLRWIIFLFWRMEGFSIFVSFLFLKKNNASTEDNAPHFLLELKLYFFGLFLPRYPSVVLLRITLGTSLSPFKFILFWKIISDKSESFRGRDR